MLWCDARILAFFYTFFFFNDTATTEIYTLSLHDALPISRNYLIELAKRTERLKLTNVIFALGEPHDPRLPASSLDSAILVHMYHEISQPYAFLYNLAPALKRGALVGIVDLKRPTSEHGTPIDLLRSE